MQEDAFRTGTNGVSLNSEPVSTQLFNWINLVQIDNFYMTERIDLFLCQLWPIAMSSWKTMCHIYRSALRLFLFQLDKIIQLILWDKCRLNRNNTSEIFKAVDNNG